MKFLYSRTSVQYLNKLEKKIAGKIVDAVEKLPEEGDAARLKGKKIKDMYRLRSGRYRIIFLREKDLIKIIKIDTRGDIYKK